MKLSISIAFYILTSFSFVFCQISHPTEINFGDANITYNYFQAGYTAKRQLIELSNNTNNDYYIVSAKVINNFNNNFIKIYYSNYLQLNNNYILQSGEKIDVLFNLTLWKNDSLFLQNNELTSFFRVYYRQTNKRELDSFDIKIRFKPANIPELILNATKSIQNYNSKNFENGSKPFDPFIVSALIINSSEKSYTLDSVNYKIEGINIQEPMLISDSTEYPIDLPCKIEPHSYCLLLFNYKLKQEETSKVILLLYAKDDITKETFVLRDTIYYKSIKEKNELYVYHYYFNVPVTKYKTSSFIYIGRVDIANKSQENIKLTNYTFLTDNDLTFIEDRPDLPIIIKSESLYSLKDNTYFTTNDSGLIIIEGVFNFENSKGDNLKRSVLYVINYIESPTSVDENEKQAILSFYPNPANDFLKISSSIIPFNISLIDMTGKLLMKINIVSSESHIDLTPYSSGDYFIEFDFGKNKYHTKLCIVR